MLLIVSAVVRWKALRIVVLVDDKWVAHSLANREVGAAGQGAVFSCGNSKERQKRLYLTSTEIQRRNRI